MAGQAFNFGTEEPLTVRELYGAVCEAVGGGYVEPAVLNRAIDRLHCG